MNSPGKIGLLIFCGVTFVFLAASIGGNNWIEIENRPGVKVTEGLWRTCSVSPTLTLCTQQPIVTDKMYAIRACASVALILAIVGGILAFVRLCKELDGKATAGLFGFGAAGVLMIIALAIYIDYTSVVIKFDSVSYGWSFYLGWVAAVLCFVCASANIVICD